MALKFHLARCPSTCVHIRVPPCIHACTAPLRSFGYATNSVLLIPFSCFFFFSLRATMATMHDGLVRGVISLVSNDFPFSSISCFTFLSILSHCDRIFPSCSSSSSSFASSFSSYFSFSFTSFSFSSILHRSGKDPPRVALHERVVDEESVKLALRQHYPAGYRYLGCLVISSRVRSTTV